jgi:hypothetical protein
MYHTKSELLKEIKKLRSKIYEHLYSYCYVIGIEGISALRYDGEVIEIIKSEDVPTPNQNCSVIWAELFIDALEDRKLSSLSVFERWLLYDYWKLPHIPSKVRSILKAVKDRDFLEAKKIKRARRKSLMNTSSTIEPRFENGIPVTDSMEVNRIKHTKAPKKERSIEDIWSAIRRDFD